MFDYEFLSNAADAILPISIALGLPSAGFAIGTFFAKQSHHKESNEWRWNHNVNRVTRKVVTACLLFGIPAYALPDYAPPERPVPTTYEGKYQQLFSTCMEKAGANDKLEGDANMITEHGKMIQATVPVCHSQTLQVLGKK